MSPRRRTLAPIFLAIGLLAGLWGWVLARVGGMSFSIAGLRVSSNTAMRPLVVSALSLSLYFLIAGVSPMLQGFTQFGRRLKPRALAIALAVITACVGLRFTSLTAGGSDSYAYISQADLWLKGALVTPLPGAADVPWPHGTYTFTPLGYTPTADDRGMVSIVPIGLPLLMAGAKWMAGQRGIFFIAPLLGGLLVWLTFVIGRRCGPPWMALCAAWLVATSPTTLYMINQPMSDVPAAVCWTAAAAAILAESVLATAAGGLLASMAILIRPNLVPIAALMGLWIVIGDLLNSTRPATQRFLRTLVFCSGVIPGCVGVAAINHWWYGAATNTGFGTTATIFSAANIAPNVVNYSRWLIETQTPLAAAGALAVLVPLRLVWRSAGSLRPVWLLSAVLLAVSACYGVYRPFDAWWYLRFFLPAWPAIGIGTAAVIAWLSDRKLVWLQIAGVAAALAIGWFGVSLARDRYAFDARQGESRYPEMAALVHDHTEPNSVILAAQHSGSVRYYAGRNTLRYDLIDPAWLDRAVAWLRDHGAHPYLVVDGWERADFHDRFAATSALGRDPFEPVLIYQGSQAVYLYDLLEPAGAKPAPLTVQSTPSGNVPQPIVPPLLTFGR